mgnify:CR=1 FL=1
MRLDSRPKVEPSQTEIETIDGRRVPVKLIVNPRARHVSVRIDPTRREAIATAPSKRHLKHAAQFAAERAGWIASELARLPLGVSLSPGSIIPLRGEDHVLAYEHGRGPARVEPGLPPRLVVPAPDVALFESRLLRFLKDQARQDLAEARLMLERAQYDLAHAEVKSPFPGRIVTRLIEPGEFLNRGSAVARVVETRYSKVLESRVTDGAGRYNFLVGNEKYVVTVEKPGYMTMKTDEIDLTVAGKEGGGVVDKDIGLTEIEKKGSPSPESP